MKFILLGASILVGAAAATIVPAASADECGKDQRARLPSCASWEKKWYDCKARAELWSEAESDEKDKDGNVICGTLGVTYFAEESGTYHRILNLCSGTITVKIDRRRTYDDRWDVGSGTYLPWKPEIPPTEVWCCPNYNSCEF